MLPTSGSYQTQRFLGWLSAAVSLQPETMHRLSINACLLALIALLLVGQCSSFVPTRPRATARFTLAAQQDSTKSISSLLKLSKNQGENDKPKYSPVEDGSPLGVAIVVLGGTFVVQNGDKFDENSPPLFLLVLGTASLAAGIARLIRFTSSNKEGKD